MTKKLKKQILGEITAIAFNKENKDSDRLHALSMLLELENGDCENDRTEEKLNFIIKKLTED